MKEITYKHNGVLEYEVKDKGYSLFYKILSPVDNPGENPYISITGYTPNYPSKFIEHEELMIPSEIDGYEVKYIARSAFHEDKNIRTVVLPDTIRALCDYAFKSSNIESIHLGSGLEQIGDGVFEHCYELENITLSNNLKTIGNSVFRGCSNLASIVLPDSLSYLGGSVFDICSSLESIHIGANLSQIGSLSYSDFAYGCRNLKKITISPLNEHFKVEKDILYNMDKKVLVKVFNVDNQKKVVIPDWVVNLSTCSFDNTHLSLLVVKPETLYNVGMAHIRDVKKVRCMPGSQIEKYFQKEDIATCSVNDNKLDNFLNEISEDIIIK